jgi:hypothetical protein
MRIYREMASRNNLVLSLAYLGYAEHKLGRGIEAGQCLAEALHMTVESRFWLSLLTMLPGLALLLADVGQVEQAVELYSLASRYPYVANSRWFEDVAGRHIALASAALSPQAVDAARKRGRGRDLWATAEELLIEMAASGARSLACEDAAPT